MSAGNQEGLLFRLLPGLLDQKAVAGFLKHFPRLGLIHGKDSDFLLKPRMGHIGLPRLGGAEALLSHDTQGNLGFLALAAVGGEAIAVIEETEMGREDLAAFQLQGTVGVDAESPPPHPRLKPWPLGNCPE